MLANIISLGNWRFTVPMRALPTLSVWSNGAANTVRNVSTGAAVGVGGNPTPTYFSLSGGSQFNVPSFASGIWCDFDLWADARL